MHMDVVAVGPAIAHVLGLACWTGLPQLQLRPAYMTDQARLEDRHLRQRQRGYSRVEIGSWNPHRSRVAPT
jgi:hypothetical protein